MPDIEIEIELPEEIDVEVETPQNAEVDVEAELGVDVDVDLTNMHVVTYYDFIFEEI